jgi:PTH1 family peptidyl-tRNA hydrolase
MGDRFPRIRVGVGRPQYDSIDHVLSPFAPDESAKLPDIIDAAARGAELWLNDSLEAAMQYLNNLEVA